jgi:hypothetical protein
MSSGANRSGLYAICAKSCASQWAFINLMRHHVGQESGYLGGSIGNLLDAVIQHDDMDCLVDLCVCHGARVLAWRRVGDKVDHDRSSLLDPVTDGRCSGVPFDHDPGSCEHP